MPNKAKTPRAVTPEVLNQVNPTYSNKDYSYAKH